MYVRNGCIRKEDLGSHEREFTRHPQSHRRSRWSRAVSNSIHNTTYLPFGKSTATRLMDYYALGDRARYALATNMPGSQTKGSVVVEARKTALTV